MNENEAFEWVRKYFAKEWHIHEAYLTPETRLAEDLGMDSLDRMAMMIQLEEQADANVDILEQEWIATLGDAARLLCQMNCGIPPEATQGPDPGPRPNYDEEGWLIWYAVEHGGRLRTNFEREVENASAARQKIESMPPEHRDSKDVASCFYGSMAHEEAIANMDAFYEKMAARIFREHAEEFLVNRCPECKKIARTPKARQCLWCGHPWRDANAS